MKERIELILTEFQLTPSRFADELGIQRSGISHIMSGRNNPSLELILKILQKFPEINSDWLVQGKGPMKNILVDPSQISLFELPVEGPLETPVSLTTAAVEPPPVIKNSIPFEIIPPPKEEVIFTPPPRILEEPKIALEPVNSKPYFTEPEHEEVRFQEPKAIVEPTLKEKIKQSEPSILSAFARVSEEKKIERIIIFYTDKSFSEHKPE